MLPFDPSTGCPRIFSDPPENAIVMAGWAPRLGIIGGLISRMARGPIQSPFVQLVGAISPDA
jgi:hypothetical protein